MTGPFGEIFLERRAGEHAAREERADDGGQADGFRGEREEERDRHRDEESAVRESQPLSLDLDSQDDSPEHIDARRHPDGEKSYGFGKEDREVQGAHPPRRRAHDDGQDNQAEDVVDDRRSQNRLGHRVLDEVELEEDGGRDGDTRRRERGTDEQGHREWRPVDPDRRRGRQIQCRPKAHDEREHDPSEGDRDIPWRVDRAKVEVQSDQEEEEYRTEDRQCRDDGGIENNSVGTQGCVSHEARAQDDAHPNLSDNRGLMESSKEKVARRGQDQKNRKLLEKGLRSRGRHCASANGLGILMDERRKGTSPVVFHFQILARVLPLSSTSRLRISRSGRQVPDLSLFNPSDASRPHSVLHSFLDVTFGEALQDSLELTRSPNPRRSTRRLPFRRPAARQHSPMTRCKEAEFPAAARTPPRRRPRPWRSPCPAWHPRSRRRLRPPRETGERSSKSTRRFRSRPLR